MDKTEAKSTKYTNQGTKDTKGGMRRVRHDTANRLLTVKGYLSEGRIKEAEEYVDHLTGESLPNLLRFVTTDNPVFDAVVNAKMAICHQKGIDLFVKTSPEAARALSGKEEGVILGNLLDNAIEAAEKSKEKRISLIVEKKEAYVSLLVRNSIERSVLSENPNLVTTKGDARLHGIGLASVRSIVEKEQGMIQFYEEDGELCCHILLDGE